MMTLFTASQKHRLTTNRIFITGTDTGVGKTFITCKLLIEMSAQGIPCLGLKPVATGCELTTAGLRNEDALAIQNTASLKLAYHDINPFAFQPAIAPHIAAAQVNTRLSVELLLNACQPALLQSAEFYIIEGAGGWLVPLNAQESMADFAQALDAAIILVVGIRVGCINHALLSYRAMQSANVIGWVANCIEPQMLAQTENIQFLEKQLPVPLLAEIPYCPINKFKN